MCAPLIPYLVIPAGLFVLHSAWAAMVGYHVLMALILGLNKDHIDWRCIRPTRYYYLLLPAALSGAAGGLLMFLLWPHLQIPADITASLNEIGLNQSNWPWFLVYFAAVNPWLEELYWRGYLGSSTVCPTVNDLFFAGYHVVVLAGKIAPVWLLAVLLVLTLIAWLWRQANRLSGGWLPSIVSHSAADISIMLVVFSLLF